MEKFPKYRYDYIFNQYNGKEIKESKLLKDGLIVKYPCRLDAMAINPAAVCYNDSMVFTPGEVVISTKKYIVVTIKKIESKNELTISKTTKRKVLVKHAFYLMKSVLKFSESFYIDVNDDGIPKHCGFGSSSSTIAAVASAINELYGCPITNDDLITRTAVKNAYCNLRNIAYCAKLSTMQKLKFRIDYCYACIKDIEEDENSETVNRWEYHYTKDTYIENVDSELYNFVKEDDSWIDDMY